MPDRRAAKRKPKPLRQRIDEILEDSETSRWSSSRLFLSGTLGVFLFLSLTVPDFRDSAAFVTIILALIGAVVAPKLLDLRVAIGSAAAAIGRKFTRKEETVTTATEESEGGAAAGGAVEEVNIEAEEVNVQKKPVVRKGE